MIEVFLIEINDEIQGENYNFLLELCSQKKRNEISIKKLKKHRDLSVVGNALSKYAIKKVFGIPVLKQEICYEKNGKPYLKGYNNIYFSISHSHNIVVCAVSDREVGIDMERIRKTDYKATKFFVNDAENITREEYFLLWTKKEAKLKQKGSGIFKEDLKKLDVSDVKSFKYKDYFISISLENNSVRQNNKNFCAY